MFGISYSYSLELFRGRLCRVSPQEVNPKWSNLLTSSINELYNWHGEPITYSLLLRPIYIRSVNLEIGKSTIYTHMFEKTRNDDGRGHCSSDFPTANFHTYQLSSSICSHLKLVVRYSYACVCVRVCARIWVSVRILWRGRVRNQCGKFTCLWIYLHQAVIHNGYLNGVVCGQRFQSAYHLNYSAST